MVIDNYTVLLHYMSVVYRFARAVTTVLRAQVLHLPNVEEMWRVSHQIEEKYHLPVFFAGIDGTFMVFSGKPR